MLHYFIQFNQKGGQLKTSGIILFVLIIIILLTLTMLSSKKSKHSFSSKQLAFSSICLTLAFVLSNIKLFNAPMGGSVTLMSTFFVTIVGYFYGTYVGIIAGVAYGFLQLITNPTFIHPVQIFLDYPLSFGALGLSGIFSHAKLGIIKGYLVGISGRLFFSIISGVLFFAEYANGKNVFRYSLTYNISYIGIEGIITIVALTIPAVQHGIKEVQRMATES